MTSTQIDPPSASTAVFPVYASLDIDASIQDVWTTLIDFEDYESCRKQILIASPSSKIPLTDQTNLQPGQYMLMHVHTPPKLADPHFLLKPFQVSQTVVQLRVIDHEKHRLAWRTCGFPEWLLWCERWQMLSSSGQDKCKYESFEVFGGVLAYVMWMICFKVLLLKGVAEMAKALSVRCRTISPRT
ncbi:hypothetical protein GYMLUDRAFT_160386 [Collybiopsis luxurians FD-317 M1]|nr:hypothetical protein GYMLUDRAFT_160386 [Collybiopsis luxurians FD-317 M1]